MCGRFAATTDPARLAEEIGALDETAGAGVRPPNYNVAPTTDILAVVARHDDPARRAGAQRPGIGDRRTGAQRRGIGDRRAGAQRRGIGDRRAGAQRPGIGDDDPVTRRIRRMRWGLLPPWAKPGPDGAVPTRGRLLINARAETVTTSPAYRSSAQHKRCLVPMDGYYEWMPAGESADAGPKARKTPFYISSVDARPLLVAGLWSVWKPDHTAAPLLTCTIITTDAIGELARVHDRMPLVLGRGDWDRWLDPDSPAPAGLLAAAPDISGIAVREVSTLVNRVANNGPELIAPAEHGNQPVGLFRSTCWR
jgi:putative SOS response-associated peptidase YedK